MSIDDGRWPYLSPSLPDWGRVADPRGLLRHVVTREITRHAQQSNALATVLDALEQYARLRTALGTELLLLVVEAHLRGAPWAEVGRRLDRTKQSVHQQYQARIWAPETRQILLSDLSFAQGRSSYPAATTHRAQTHEVPVGSGHHAAAE
jgi:hypothetical protein